MIDPIALRLGPIEIRWYALAIVTGLVLAIYLAQKEAPKRGIQEDHILDMILWAFPLAIIGARIYYVAFEWSYYSQHPDQILAIWNGGIAIYGGLLTGALVLYLYCRQHLIEPLDFLDIAAPSVMIAQSIGRWGNFFNQEAYGAKVDSLPYLPEFIRKQMYIDGAYRQPTFLYESIWNLVGFGLTLLLRKYYKNLRRGDLTAFYLVWYGLGRLYIEGLRTDSLMLGDFRVSQVLSAVLIILGGLLFYRQHKAPAAPLYHKKS